MQIEKNEILGWVSKIEIISFLIFATSWVVIPFSLELQDSSRVSPSVLLSLLSGLIIFGAASIGLIAISLCEDGRLRRRRVAITGYCVVAFAVGIHSTSYFGLFDGRASDSQRYLSCIIAGMRAFSLLWMFLYLECRAIDLLADRTIMKHGSNMRLLYIAGFIGIFLAVLIVFTWFDGLFEIDKHPGFGIVNVLLYGFILLFGLRCVRPFWTEKYGIFI